MKFKNVEDIYPLSPMQQGILFHNFYDPHSAMYFEIITWTIHGALNVEAFEQAWQSVVDRHTILRTFFVWEGLDEPLQVVRKSARLPLRQEDWRGLSPAEHQSRLEEYIASERERGFDLSAAPLMRIALMRTGEDDYRFVWSYHHVLVDGWSVSVIFSDVFNFYESLRRGVPCRLKPSRPFREYIDWQRQQDLAQAEDFWRRSLRGFAEPTMLAVGRGPAAATRLYNEQQLLLSTELTAALQTLARRHQLTLNTIFQGAWALLLSRYGGTHDVVFGVAVSGRPPQLPNIESMVGMLVNTLPARVEVEPDAPLLPWLEAIQAHQVEMRKYEYTPLVQIQGWSEVARGIQLFDSIVAFENHPIDGSLATASGGGAELRDVVHYHTATGYPLNLIVEPGTELNIKNLYDIGRFDDATIEHILGHFRQLLTAIAADPHRRLSELPLLTEAEEQQLITEWSSTSRIEPVEESIHGLFETQVERTPERIALVVGDERLTYRELNRRANQLAQHLRKLGVRREVPVALFVERSTEMVVALLGILKAGGAYVPLDPGYPAERLALMLDDAQPPVLLTQARLLNSLPARACEQTKVVCLDADRDSIAREADENPQRLTDAAKHLAYFIYTSGSTGRPKGVAITHGSVAIFLHWAREVFDDEQLAGVMASTSISFDLSVFELFAPLSWGGKVILAENALHLPTLEASAEVTLINTVPSAMAQLVRMNAVPPRARTVNLAGEPLPRKLVQQLYGLKTVSRVFNLYGPSEDTTYSTFTLVGSDEPGPPSIGRPVSNTQAYLVDSELRPVPVGVAGELCLGGDGLARGYHNRPALTAEKFIPDPFSRVPGARLYRTGDLARWMPDGNIEFLGRRDHQVKVRGFRIELGEVEASIEAYAGVRECIVVAREDVPGDKRLVAYVVPQRGRERPSTPEVSGGEGDELLAGRAEASQEQRGLSPDGLRHYLREKLPAYMIPSAFVVLGELPLTPNGKVDRRALPAPEPDAAESADTHVAPRTPVEEIVAGIYAGVLGVEGVGATSDFFELGGHSLLAAQVISRVRETFKVELSLRKLFLNPTVEALAVNIERSLGAGEDLASSRIERAPREGDLPLSFSQQRLWFIDQMQPGTPFYNITAAVNMRGELNLEALSEAFAEIARRHEVLRTTFAAVDGRPVQIIRPTMPLALSVEDVPGASSEERAAAARLLAQEEAARSFDLRQGPLLRVRLLRLGEYEHIALLTMHHIISDGWSIGVLVNEVGALYGAFAQGRPSPLDELPVQYVDFALWERAALTGQALEDQLAYWREQLRGAPPVLELASDRPRPLVSTFRGGSSSFTLPAALTDELKALSRREGATLYMTLLAAFQCLLTRYTGQEDIVVGTPVANRDRTETEGLIGFFVNTLSMRTDLSGNPTFWGLLGRVREVALGAYAHQGLPFEKLVEELQPERSLNHAPIFQVMFILQNMPMGMPQLPGLQLEGVPVATQWAKFDLTFALREEGGQLFGEVEYSAELFDEETIRRMARHFEQMLESIVRDPGQKVGELELLGEEERRQIVGESDQTAREYQREVCIHELFEQQVARTPDATALMFEDAQLSYRELNERANRLAHGLRSMGVGVEVRVGILMERSLEMVVAMLGVLKAGGAYVPLDPAYPQERVSFMLEDAAVPVLLTQESLAEKARTSGARVLLMDAERAEFAGQSVENLKSGVREQNLAYVIYTSGSTGTPKGVAIEHRSAATLIFWAGETFPPRVLAGVLASTSICFDLSIFELFVPLSWGGRVILARNALELPALPRRAEVRLINTVPSAINELLRLKSVPKTVEVVNLAGEALSPVLVADIYAQTEAQEVWNLYGPSEDTTYTTAGIMKREGGRVTVGRGIANTGLYILDKWGAVVPSGVSGELYIGGAGLARGYLKRPEITAERFVPNPFSATPGARLYRTGDLVRRLPDGEIEFLGRIDHQVKIRGFRIELGEIEHVLSQHPSLQESLVVAQEHAPGDVRLVAYFVADGQPGDGHELIKELKAHLREKLPEYMVPSFFVALDAFPLTPNGKIDRRALPEARPASPDADAAYVAPRSALERTISEIWRELLGVEQIGVHVNFFDLGGHSLLLAQAQHKLREALGRDVAILDLFKYTTIDSLARYLGDDRNGASSVTAHAPRQADRLKAAQSDHSIAIIGLAGRFPGAADADQFWRNLCAGQESITFFSDEELASAGIDSETLKDSRYVKAQGVIDGVEQFDAGFFDITPREAEMMDPQQRHFLECAWEALENAGYDPAAYGGSIGVYAGSGMNTYWINVYSHPELVGAVGPYQTRLANDKDFLPTRLSYKFNLRGPSINVQTACSTSLVAVHLAAQSLLNGECDIALAGGVTIGAQQKSGYVYQEGGIHSPDGHCRPFDAAADGTVGGNGVGIVVLKRLEEAVADGDHIFAVIKGSAINNDGSLKIGYTAPSIEGQAAVISEALASARFEPETIGYVEAHGTGTSLGDPIEVAALMKAFHSTGERPSRCAIGAVKSNIGHLDAAAGVAGLIKTALILKHGLIPPTLHFQSPNPSIDFEHSPFYVTNEQLAWKSDASPRRAGVSSFGIGGTNAHVVLEEAPPVQSSDSSRPYQLLLLSARTTSALETATENLTSFLRQNRSQNLADVAFTLQVGRRTFAERRIVVCGGLEDAIGALEARGSARVFDADQPPTHDGVLFMFPGQGAQYAGMGRDLYLHEATFRETVDYCAEFLKPLLEIDLREVLYSGDETGAEADERLRQTYLTQALIFVIECATSKLWIEWGVRPQAMIGHSLGEYTAAYLAGVFTLDEALQLIALRGRLMQQLPSGSMLSVRLSEQDVLPLLNDDLSLAAVNGPSQCVVSGRTPAIDALQQSLEANAVACSRLHTSHAFHSQMVEPILDEFDAALRAVNLRPPQIPFISNVTGKWITAEEAMSADYWVRHLRQTVRFDAGLREVFKETRNVLLEVGPGRVLSTLAKSHPHRDERQPVLASLEQQVTQKHEVASMLEALGRLVVAGVTPDWSGFYKHERRQRLPLPTYPFERQPYWLDAGKAAMIGPQAHPLAGAKQDVADWYYVPAWKVRVPPSIPPLDAASVGSRWLLFLDRDGLGSKLADALIMRGEEVITVETGAGFTTLGEHAYSLNPRRSEDYRRLLEELRRRDSLPGRIIHLWGLTPVDEQQPDSHRFDEAQYKGLYSLVFLTQALAAENVFDPIRIEVVSTQIQDVDGRETLSPEKATVLGACKVIPQEYANLFCRNIDITLPAVGSRQEERLINDLTGEFYSDTTDGVIAYRKNCKWVQTYEPLHLTTKNADRSVLRKGGAYLVVGGLGRIGLVLARALAREAGARLTLTSRTGLPDRASWDERLHSDGDSEIGRRIRAVRELEQSGAEVLTLAADVASEQEMREAVARTLERFGTLHGVIHASGIVGEEAYRSIDETKESVCQAQFEAKAHGLRVLEKTLAGIELDFCLMVSSLSSWLGGLGYSAYSAANIFMDTFVLQHNRAGAQSWTSLNWDAWRFGVDEATGGGLGSDFSRLAITPEEGTEAFLRLLSISDVPQVLISTTELQSRSEQWLRASPQASSAPPASSSARQRRRVETDYVAPQTQIEKSIVEVWQQLLGIERIGLHDNFFELGGDSLLATQAVSRIRHQVGVDVPLRSFLETANVAALAEAIAQRQSQKGQVAAGAISSDEVSLNLPGMLHGGKSIDEALGELDALSDEEVSTLLERARQTSQGDS